MFALRLLVWRASHLLQGTHYGPSCGKRGTQDRLIRAYQTCAFAILLSILSYVRVAHARSIIGSRMMHHVFIYPPLFILHQVGTMDDQLYHYYASFDVSFLVYPSAQSIGIDGTTCPQIS